jgi:hypothetical protein
MVKVLNEFKQRDINGVMRGYIEYECSCNKVFIKRSDNTVPKHCGCMKGYNKNHELYSTWCNMKSRCLNPNFHKYRTYGARGIKVYESWIKNFIAFKNYVSGLVGYDDRKALNLTLDRIDNNGNYEPENLRWATKADQTLNSNISLAKDHPNIAYRKDRGCYKYHVNREGKHYQKSGFKTAKEAYSAMLDLCREKNLYHRDLTNP